MVQKPLSSYPRSSSRARICLIACGLLVVAVILLHTTSAFDRLDPFGWKLNRGIETYDFIPTQDEQQCLQGDTLALSKSNLSPIPNVAHFIWGIKNVEVDFMLYLAIRSAMLSLKPTKIKLHYKNINLKNPWLMKLHKDIELVHHDVDEEFQHQIKAGWHPAHIADWLRLRILQEEGGVYLDSDVIVLRSFDGLRNSNKDVVLGHEGGSRWGLCNAVILARRGSDFLERWTASYTTFSDSKWNYHSVLLPKIMADENPNEVCKLAPDVLFWPTWTPKGVDHMHESLSEEQAREVQRTLTANGGSLYQDQLAYHAWSQLGSKYLKKLTPERIRKQDTRFNLMTRRFLSADD